MIKGLFKKQWFFVSVNRGFALRTRNRWDSVVFEAPLS